ncbi:hypothetical protein Q2T42_27555 [Leptolyngbya boryana CZ1]|uniref:Uncharacterized protein n=1 Tax=Leptolyngbya boryana CZ1 TaxID=3060204 RepID=A0AA96X3N9_LEPBY|nr:hypothetical protein [Leptolyngbya boryana]WNZ49279.1 hypothetical protein Q2T42_27555 [Leptolyngbya boryana CZ1]
MGVPRGNEGGSGHPSAECQEGTGEEQDARPTDEDESVAFEPVIESVKDSSLRRATYCDGHY